MYDIVLANPPYSANQAERSESYQRDMEGALSLGALFVLGMVLSPQENSLRLDELSWFLQSYLHYHKKKRKKHNNILSPMYGTKYSNTIHPELQLLLLLACPLLPLHRDENSMLVSIVQLARSALAPSGRLLLQVPGGETRQPG